MLHRCWQTNPFPNPFFYGANVYPMGNTQGDLGREATGRERTQLRITQVDTQNRRVGGPIVPLTPTLI